LQGNGGIIEIRDTGSGKVYGKWPVPESGEFSIEFIHSVNMSPVKETFKIKERKIYLQQVKFSSFGAGMLSDLEEGMTLERDGEELVIGGFNNASLEELKFIVGTVSDHVLFIGGEEVSLRDLCGRNAHITIRAK
jgi:hypothetical protein